MFDQQHLLGIVQKATTRHLLQDKLVTGMVVIGRVSGSVSLKDLGRIINQGSTVHLTEHEINKSKDLQEAILKGWIEVLDARGHSRQYPTNITYKEEKIQERVRVINNAAAVDNQEKMINLAKQMAKEMSIEMMKSNQTVMDTAKELAKEMAKEMTAQILANMPKTIVTQTTQQTSESKNDKIIMEEVSSADIFIDIQESNAKLQASELGTVKEEKTDVTGQLEKMKRFKRKQ